MCRCHGNMNKYKQVFYYYIVLFQVYRKDTVIIKKVNKQVFKIGFVDLQFFQSRLYCHLTFSLNIVIFVYLFFSLLSLGTKHVSEANWTSVVLGRLRRSLNRHYRTFYCHANKKKKSKTPSVDTVKKL